MNNKFVITGAPGTGKTTIINMLKQKGHSCAEEIYVTDTERKENIEQARNIEKEITFAYQSFGHSLIPIPKLPTNERADFILSKI